MKHIIGQLLIIFSLLPSVYAAELPVGNKPSTSGTSGSKPNHPSAPRPSSPAPATKSYGSGTPPSNSSNPAATKSYGSGKPDKPPATKSYGSGKPDKPPAAKSYGSGKPDKPPAAKSYGSGKPDKPPTDQDSSKVGTKPKFTNYDQKAADARKKEQSKAAFLKGKEPASSYVDPKGNTVKIDPRDEKIQRLRNQLSEEKWQNRELRQQQFYQNYYNRPVVVYHDIYSSLFWWWLLDRSIEQQALWAYHHRSSMDTARYNDLISRNAELAARVKALEQQNVPRNPTYQPSGVDADLMYQDNYVRAAYNPTSKESNNVLWILLWVFAGFVVVGFIIWALFVKKW